MVNKKIPLAHGSYLYSNGEQPLSKDFIDSYISQIEEKCSFQPYLNLESIASFLSNESKRLKPSLQLPKYSFEVCAKRLLKLAGVQNNLISGTSQSIKNLKSSITSVNNYCESTTHIAGNRFKLVSDKLVTIAESINNGEFPQSSTKTGRDRFILFEATKIIRETLGHFPSSNTTATIISMLTGKTKSRQWVENNITPSKKEEIEYKIQQAFKCSAILETPQNITVVESETTTVSKLSDNEVFTQIKSIIKQADNPALLGFLVMRIAEAENDWGVF